MLKVSVPVPEPPAKEVGVNATAKAGVLAGFGAALVIVTVPVYPEEETTMGTTPLWPAGQALFGAVSDGAGHQNGI